MAEAAQDTRGTASRPAQAGAASPAPSQTDQRRVLECVMERIGSGRRFVLATVLEAVGSTPAKTGAMAVIEDGRVVAGTVGGGEVEARSECRARELADNGHPEMLRVSLGNEDVAAAEPICGGVVRLVLDPDPARHAPAYAAALESFSRRQGGVLRLLIRGEAAVELITAWQPEPSLEHGEGKAVGDVLRAGLEAEAPGCLATEAMAGQAPVEVLAMPVVPRPLLVIVGGGHVGQAIAAQAALVGFDLLVVEDREGFAHPALFPSGTSIRFGRPAAELGALTLDSTTYVVLVSRNHLTDAEALAVCLRRPAAYLGMIGSRRKIRMLRESWIASGRATVADFDRLYAPIGLDLGALTVPEIACSVVAQLVAVRRKGKAPRLI